MSVSDETGGGADAPPPGSPAWWKAAAPMLRAAGVPLPPGVDETAMPEVYLGPSVLEIAQKLGDLCRREPLYRMDKTLVTIDEDSGRTEPMTPHAFVTWIEERVACCTMIRKEKVYKSMTPETAKLILASHRFRGLVRPLRAVHRVRMPVFRAKGELELLRPGYDAESGILTTRGGVDYREDLPVEEAVKYLTDLLKTFPWGDPEQGMANMVAYLVTMLCRALYEGDKTPAFAFNANLVGSGKSKLAELGLYMIHGKAGATTLWERHEELKKELDMAAQEARPYLFFDNVKTRVDSPLLDAWATNPLWTGRIMGTRLGFEMPTLAQLIYTGNGLKMSEDQMRRCRWIDLFAEETVGERKKPETLITDRWLQTPGNQAALLAAVYALVRYAFVEEKGRADAVDTGPPLASFETWSDITATAVMRAGFANPLNKITLPDAGNLVEDDAARTIAAVIRGLGLTQPGLSRKVTLQEMVPAARREGAFVEKLGTIEEVMLKLDAMKDGWKEETYPAHDGMGTVERLPHSEEERRAQAAAWLEPARGKDRGTLASIGYWIKQRCGRKFTVDGGVYKFSDRKESRMSTYLVTRLE